MRNSVTRRGNRVVSFAIDELEDRRLLSRSPIALPFSALSDLLGGSQSIVVSSGAPAVVTQQSGALTGKVVYTQGGHGYTYMADTSNPGSFIWETQRPFINSMVEDAGNQDQMTYFADYALKAGATVVPIRAVGHQDNMVIVDNSDPGYSVIQGTFSTSTGSPYWSDNSGNDAVHYTFANGTGNPNQATATAQFTPNLPAAGFYPVYTWYRTFTDRSTSAAFTINYAGGSYTVHIDQQLTGNGWVYLGTYYFNAGTSGNVQVSNASSSTGAVIADAVRFGNGRSQLYNPTTGAAIRYGDGATFPANATVGPNTMSIEDLAGIYWAYASRGWTAANTRVSTQMVDGTTNDGASSDDNTLDFGAPDRWATYMNNEASGSMTDRIWLSFHSNAAGTGSGSRGTYGLINSVPTPNQAAYALLMGQTIATDMQSQDSRWQFPWGVQPYTFNGQYSEISNNIIDGEFDATIVEVAYHDNAEDAALLEDPKVRDAVAKSAVHGIISYFHQFGGATNVTTAPEAPTDVRAVTDANGNVTISWSPGLSGSPYGNAATGYRVYTSTNGYGFGNGFATTSTSLTLSGLPANSVTYLEVTATNAGGESFASPVVAAKPQPFKRAPILIVNDFSRLDGTNDQTQTSDDFQGNNANETYLRVRERYNNTQDYVVQGASAIAAFNPNLGIESCSASAIANGEINLSDYQTVIWMSGSQGSADGTFTAALQPKVTAYLNAGGKMFISGSEIGFDLVSAGHGASFYQNTLHTNFVADDANTYNTAGGISGSALAGVPALSFDDGTHGSYNVQFPDVIGPSAGSTTAMNYSGGSGGAAVVQYSSGSTQVIDMGFPFESIYTTSQRNSLMSAVLNFFNADSTLVSGAPSAPDLAAASDTGILNSDNITSRNNSSASSTLQFTVGGVTSGATVTLFADGVQIGSGLANSTSITFTTDGVTKFADGVHNFTAEQLVPGFSVSPMSSPLAVTIDTTAPIATIASPSPNPRDTSVSSLAITFSETVAGFDRGDLTLTRNAGTNLLTSSQTLTGGGASYVINNLDALTAASGAYRLGLTGVTSGITDIAGNPLITNAASIFGVGTIIGDATPNANDTVRVTTAGPGQVAIFVNNTTDTPDFTWTIAAGQPLIVNTGGGDDTLIIQGPLPNDVIFNGGTGSDTLDVQSGSYTFNSDAVSGTVNLTVDAEAGASVVFNTSQHLGGLNLNGGTATLASGGNKVLVTGALSISNGGVLDLADNDMIVNYSGTSPLSTIQGYLASAFNAGNWNGAGLTSSMAQADPMHLRALGYAENSDLGLSTFDGQPVGAQSLLVKYTFYGDNNLDGVVDVGNDFNLFIDGETNHGSTWFQGDYTYDGKVDLGNDFNLFVVTMLSQGATPPPPT